MSTQLPLVLALDVGGTPARWITYQDAAYYYAKELVAWSLGQDDQFTLHGGKSRMTGDQSLLDIDTIIAIKGQVLAKHSTHMFRVPLTNRALFRRDLNICGYCGNEYGAARMTRDHIHPRSKGGKDVWENVVSACGSCNKYKGSKSLKDARMELLYVPYAPCRSEYLILMNRRILADQMEFLQKQIKNKSSRAIC